MVKQKFCAAAILAFIACPTKAADQPAPRTIRVIMIAPETDDDSAGKLKSLTWNARLASAIQFSDLDAPPMAAPVAARPSGPSHSQDAIRDFFSAAREGRAAQVKWFIDNDPGIVNVKDEFHHHQTALMITSSPDVARLLLTHGADLTATDDFNQTAQMHAQRDGKTDIAPLLNPPGSTAVKSNATNAAHQFPTLPPGV